MIRVGVVGLGMAAAPHALALIDLQDEIKVAAAFSPSPERRQAFREKYNLPVVDTADAVFADPSIGMVLLLTPPNTHLDLVTRAASMGKHVLLEKPLETTLQRAEQLVEVCDKAGVKLGVVLQHRFRPVGTALRTIIAEGRLGQLVGASARLSNWRPQSYYDQPGRGTVARDGGGVLLTQGIHTLDLLISLAGLPSEVTGYTATSRVHEMETEDIAFAALRFADGAIGSVAATTAAYPGYPDAIEIIGTTGTARIDGDRLTVHFHDGATFEASDGSPAGGVGGDPMAFGHEHHRSVMREFISAIRDDRAPLVSGREALKVHRLIGSILRSAQSGNREPV